MANAEAADAIGLMDSAMTALVAIAILLLAAEAAVTVSVAAEAVAVAADPAALVAAIVPAAEAVIVLAEVAAAVFVAVVLALVAAVVVRRCLPKSLVKAKAKSNSLMVTKASVLSPLKMARLIFSCTSQRLNKQVFLVSLTVSHWLTLWLIVAAKSRRLICNSMVIHCP